MQLSRYIHIVIFTFLNASYLEDTLLENSETCCVNYSKWDLSMGKFSDHSFKLKFCDSVDTEKSNISVISQLQFKPFQSFY
jgi:hypothetical protein